MDIFIKEMDTGAVFQFPMMPEKITTRAAARFLSYDIMKTGEHKIPLGEELVTFAWDGMLPGAPRKGQPYVRTDAWMEPNLIQGKFSVWRYRGKKLLLTVTGTPINHAVYLTEYQCTASGGAGDIDYSVSFCVAKDVTVSIESKTASGTAKTTSKTTTPQAKPAARTYTVKSGDSLWKIAQQQLGKGSRWREIYTLNKTAIDGRNKGKKVDQYTIYAGQVFNMPS